MRCFGLKTLARQFQQQEAKNPAPPGDVPALLDVCGLAWRSDPVIAEFPSSHVASPSETHRTVWGMRAGISLVLSLFTAVGGCSAAGTEPSDTGAGGAGGAGTGGGTNNHAGRGGQTASAAGTTSLPSNDHTDNVAASVAPPGGLEVVQVPLFLAIGWDDNTDPVGLTWALDLAEGQQNHAGTGNSATYDGTPLTMSFYNTASAAPQVGELWQRAYLAGHEIGNHTNSHAEDLRDALPIERWQTEIATANATYVSLGIPAAQLFGFRTPFLATSEDVLLSVEQAGFWYDASLEEGFESAQDGRSFVWPYTLDTGSPGNELLVLRGSKRPIEPHPGLWEMPVYAFMVPPDEACNTYGIEPGLRDRLKERVSYFDTSAGRITGFDWNLWEEFSMTPLEVSAVLRFSLAQRWAGNRAPFLLGAHTDLYGAGLESRRVAIEELLAAARLLPDVRVVRAEQVLRWMRAPVALRRE